MARALVSLLAWCVAIVAAVTLAAQACKGAVCAEPEGANSTPAEPRVFWTPAEGADGHAVYWCNGDPDSPPIQEGPSTEVILPCGIGRIDAVQVIVRGYEDTAEGRQWGPWSPPSNLLFCGLDPDLDDDCHVGASDAQLFLDAFEDGDPAADLDRSGGVNATDFVDWFIPSFTDEVPFRCAR